MAYSESLSASDDAWSAFLRARFNAQRSSATLDYELQILLDPKTAVMARQLRNESVSACRLPPEVLATIFSFAQNDWQYERLSQERQQFSIGWKSITRVCCLWRKVCILDLLVVTCRLNDLQVALETASLWCDIPCYSIPIQEAPYILSRTGSSPLNLQFYGHDLSPDIHDIVSAHLESWMAPTVCLRLRSLTLYEPAEYFRMKRWLVLLRAAMPRLESLHIDISQFEAGDDIVLSGGLLPSSQTA
ncbi:hypothetical protein PENSPDRAFT_223363 [Peniophora sp. CONT]|nr:hypothetical protein PENSPDRAFT_223363 [Peniophora sp. CONT]